MEQRKCTIKQELLQIHRPKEKFLERKTWPEPTSALRAHEPVCNIKGKEHADEFLEFGKRIDKYYYYFF